ncbi:MAG TPA: 50S ribosomal protein L29 [Candidatus Paceibacterota bacterium]|nr:50S ribosomal protein L29 [Candidatus Paceibacterota bacterium]
MKKKDIQQLKNKPDAELHAFVKDGRERLRVLKFDLAAGKVKDVSEIRSLKRNIARALTFIHQTDKS